MIERYRRWFEYEKDSHAKTLQSLNAVAADLRTTAEFAKALYLMGHIIAGRRITRLTDEVASLCPVTQQPDLSRVVIEYSPVDWCVESKSLKLYLWSFRNDGIFYERAVNRILDDLSACAKPRRMEVVGDFNIRGGIKSVITARVGKRE